MLYSHLIVFLSFFIMANTLLAESPEVDEFDDAPTIEPLYAPTVPDEVRKFIENERKKEKKSISDKSDFSELDLKKMDLVFKTSPREAQLIVKHLQDPTYFPLNEDYRSAIFVGEPGSGKTTMAKAIGYEMTKHGWEYKIISSTSLLGEQRNHTAIKLQKELEAIEASRKPTILIIDELNLLMENTESKHHDTDATAKALWMFIDKQSGNKNFFFIGTMNRINKLPKPYKNRILCDYITFPLIADSATKAKFFRNYLTSSNTELDKSITNDFLNKEVERIGDSSGRDLENISKAICRTSKMNETSPSSPLIIKQAAISHAIDQYLKKKKESDYNLQEETDEERQNRHHKENLDMQERHFIQQHKIQMAVNNHQYVKVGSTQNHHFISKDGENAIEALVSDEQNQLYNDMMKKTNQRRTAEEAAAKKAAADKAAAIAAEKERNSLWNRTSRIIYGEE